MEFDDEKVALCFFYSLGWMSYFPHLYHSLLFCSYMACNSNIDMASEPFSMFVTLM